jgi:hypothetical protein
LRRYIESPDANARDARHYGSTPGLLSSLILKHLHDLEDVLLTAKLYDAFVAGAYKHSSTFQLNLSRFRRKIQPKWSLEPPNTSQTPSNEPLRTPNL